MSDGSDNYLTKMSEFRKEVIPIQVENPSQMGNYEVEFITYGSGTNKRRSEFDKDADIKTTSVDASTFIEVWGRQAKFRKKYWGFDFHDTPINGLVWYPKGEGPFPLVLMVHGNHFMTSFSDPGYKYLGRLLASRGFICVSIDENFFNSLLFGPMIGENDARAWLLLKHLEFWREWNKTNSNRFYSVWRRTNLFAI